MGRHTSFGVALEAQHNLWSSVPSRGYIFCHVPGILLGINRETTSQAEVANLQIAVLVDQNVARLQVPVYDAGRVHIFQTAHYLVQEILDELSL